MIHFGRVILSIHIISSNVRIILALYTRVRRSVGLLVGFTNRHLEPIRFASITFWHGKKLFDFKQKHRLCLLSIKDRITNVGQCVCVCDVSLRKRVNISGTNNKLGERAKIEWIRKNQIQKKNRYQTKHVHKSANWMRIFFDEITNWIEIHVRVSCCAVDVKQNNSIASADTDRALWMQNVIHVYKWFVYQKHNWILIMLQPN